MCGVDPDVGDTTIYMHTVGEVAGALRVSRSTIINLIHLGHIRAIRVGKQFRVSEGELQRLVTHYHGYN